MCAAWSSGEQGKGIGFGVPRPAVQGGLAHAASLAWEKPCRLKQRQPSPQSRALAPFISGCGMTPSTRPLDISTAAAIIRGCPYIQAEPDRTPRCRQDDRSSLRMGDGESCRAPAARGEPGTAASLGGRGDDIDKAMHEARRAVVGEHRGGSRLRPEFEIRCRCRIVRPPRAINPASERTAGARR